MGGERHSTTSSMVNTTLREEVAWAIATKWHDQLRGRVKLLEASDDFELVDSYEWIQVDFYGDSHAGVGIVLMPQHLAAAARAATIAWAALARCPGYGIHENSVFWKRVFCDVSRVKSHIETQEYADAPESTYFEPVTDRTRLFTRSDSVFPRVRLNFGRTSDINDYDWHLPVGVAVGAMSTFCGMKSSSIDVAEVESDDPLIDKIRGAIEKVDAASAGFQNLLKIDPISKVRRMLKKLQKLQGGFPSKLSDVRIPVSVQGIPKSELSKQHQFMLTNSTGKDENLPMFELDDVPSDTRIYQPQQASSRKEYAEQLIDKLGIGRAEPPPSLYGLHLFPYLVQDGTLAALFASLPFATAIDAVAFKYYRGRFSRGDRYNLSAMDWKLLGFAMFHPRAAQSSWRKLDLSMSIDEESAEAFTRMAQGNNLIDCTDEFGSPTVCNGYYSATIGESAPIYTDPDTTSAVLHEVTANTTVDVCGIVSPDEVHRRDLVAVVLPGFGLGWIQSTVIKDVVCRPPNPTPVLTHLATSGMCSDRIFPLISANLVSLDASISVDNDQLERILRLTPHLKSLDINHDGSFWKEASPSVLSEMPRLKSLRVHNGSSPPTCFEPSAFAISSALSELEELRVSRYDESTREATLSFLRSHRRLRFVHWYENAGEYYWSSESWPNKQPPYEHSQEYVRKKLFGDDEVDVAVMTGLAPLTLPQKLAFVGCVKHSQRFRGSNSQHRQSQHFDALSRFDRGVLEAVLSFAGTPFVRELWID